jgi:hypothetical protein
LKRANYNQIIEIRKLSAAGYSLNVISAMTKLAKSTIYYYAKSNCYKMTKFDVNLLSEEERGYIVGLFLGDGSFNRGCKEPRFFVRFALDAKRDKDVALRIAQIIGKAGKRIKLIPWKSNIIAKTCSKELFTYMQSYIKYTKAEKTLLGSNDWSDSFKYGFIAGIIDSDGHVHQHFGTEIKTVSPQNFEGVSSILRTLEISVKTRVRDAPSNSYSNKPRYIIYISSSEMKRIKLRIPAAKIARYR